jgi:hypothetical protein
MEGNKFKASPQMLVIGINLLVLIVYTLYLKVEYKMDEFAIITEAFCIAVQIILCLIMAIAIYHKEFLLSALVVLLIGFSTCWAVFLN